MNLNILTVAERDMLVECEKIIEQGKQTFVEVGLALTKIRDRRLYRVKYATFEEYCQKRWGWTRQRAQQLMEAANIVTLLPAASRQQVTSESQARALKQVPEQRRAAVVASAAGTGAVTAKTIEAAAEKIQDAEIVHRDATEFEREIPAEILPLWQEADDTARRLIAGLQSAKNEISRGIEDREKNLVWADCTNSDVSGLMQVLGTLKLVVKPYAVCPICNGSATRKHCKLCKKRGFIGRHLWESCVPEETKKMLAKLKSK